MLNSPLDDGKGTIVGPTGRDDPSQTDSEPKLPSHDWNPHRASPIQSLLDKLDLRPTKLVARRGSTAPATQDTDVESSLTTLRLPLEGSQHQSISRRILLMLFEVCEDVAALLPNPWNENGPPLNAKDAVDFLSLHGYSITAAQRSVPRSRLQAAKVAATVKGKAPAYVSPYASRTSSRSPSPAVRDDVDDVGNTLGPEYADNRKGMPCGHIFAQGEAIWRCRDCALDDTCVQCATCFNASIHQRENHDVVFSVCATSGGCCDCGDDEAWVQNVGCTFHSPAVDSPSAHQLPPTADNARFDDIHMMAGQNSQNSHLPEAMSEDLDRMVDALVPTELSGRLRDVFAAWLDFLLRVLKHGPGPQKLFPRSFSLGASAAAARKISVLPSLYDSKDLDGGGVHAMTQQSGGSLTSEKSMTDSDSSNRTTAITAATDPAISDAAFSNKAGRRTYALALWNDEKHSFRDVIDTVKEALGIDEAAARGVAERVDKHGRDILAVSADLNELVKFARKMSGMDLEVSIVPAYDIFCEEIANCIISVMKDVSEALLYVSNPNAGAVANSQGDPTSLKLLLCSLLLQPWSISGQEARTFASPHMRQDFFDPSKLCRVDGLLLMDQRLCKEAREWMRGFYMSIVTRKQGRRAIALRFAAMYPKILETYILREREPEHSVVLITVQLFSAPSVATELVKASRFLETLAQMLASIYTGLLDTANQTLQLPPTLPARANSAATLVKQPYCRHIFYDIRYLLQAEGVKMLIATDPHHLSYLVDLLALFNVIYPEIRQGEHHIEFESETWLAVFQVSQLLARHAKLCGEALQKSTNQALIEALNSLLLRTLQSCLALHRWDPQSQPPTSLHTVEYAGQLHQVVDFEVASQATSFHHPLHWLLAEVMKGLSRFRQQDLELLKRVAMPDLLTSVDSNGLLVILDYPLRAVVKTAQVRCGLWVRNGISTRGQMNYYRDVAMRSTMYDQDIFSLQIGLALSASVDRLLCQYLDRFDIIGFFCGRSLDAAPAEYRQKFDVAQELQCAEEFLLLLIVLVSEPGNICGWSLEKLVRREIIHFLALSPCSFSALARHIPDSMTDHPSFERILATVSTYRAPGGAADQGMFELKDEFLDEIDPFFHHYSRNHRERAEEVLRDRAKRKSQSSQTFKPAASPALFEDANAASTALLRVFCSETFNEIIRAGFLQCHSMLLEDKDVPDGVMDALLHLTILSLRLCSNEFLQRSGGDQAMDDQSLNTSSASTIDLLCRLENSPKAKPFKARIAWCLDFAAENGPRNIHSMLQAIRAGSAQDTGPKRSADAKRAAAKARQAAIMQRFNAQQKSVLQSLENESLQDEARRSSSPKDAMDVDGDPAKANNFGSCIVCQGQLDHETSFGRLALIAPSRTIRTTPRNDIRAFKEILELPLDFDSGRTGSDASQRWSHTHIAEENKYNPHDGLGSTGGGFPREDHKSGFVASSCGHLMHVECLTPYVRGVHERHTLQVARNHAEDLSRAEFVCPLCKSLCNVLLPVPMELSKRERSPPAESSSLDELIGHQTLDETPVSDWLRKINIDILKSSGGPPSSGIQDSATGSGCFLSFYPDNALSALNRDGARNDHVSPAGLKKETLTMLERLMTVMRPLGANSRSQRSAWQTRTILAPLSRKLYMPEELIGYTLSLMEVCQRGLPASSQDGKRWKASAGVSDVNIGLLQSLLYCLRCSAKFDYVNSLDGTKDPDIAQAEGKKALRHGLLKRLLPHWTSDEAVRYPLLLRDPLAIIIEAAVITPEYLSQVTTIMYYACLVQTIFGLAQPSVWPQTLAGSTTRGLAHLGLPGVSQGEKDALLRCFPDVRWMVGSVVGFVGYARGNITIGLDNLDDTGLAKMLCMYTLPFLRRAAILRRAVCGESVVSARADSLDRHEGIEYLRLMDELQILAPAQGLPAGRDRPSAIWSMIEGWIKHSYAPLATLFRPLPISASPLGGNATALGDTVASHSNALGHTQSGSGGFLHLHTPQNHPTLQLEHPTVYELVVLPQSLTSLLQYSQRTACRRCKQIPHDPALCLFCGEVVCFQTFCCQDTENERGECNLHVNECDSNCGLFFKLKANALLLLCNGNGTFNASPYLDSHGEVDWNLQKGRPQTLQHQRYEDLRRQWLTSNIPAMIARKMEATMNIGGWETA